MSSEARTPREAGFSLVETLIALAIVAAMMGLYAECVVAYGRAVHVSQQRRDAVLLAQSLLADAAERRTGANLPTRGRQRGLDWQVGRRAITQGARDSGVPLREVAVEVRDAGSGRRLVAVRTLELDR